MGRALAEAALALGHEVVIVSGPVEVEYPPQARVVPVVSTEDMLAAAAHEFETCDGLIGAAAPCDYRPVRVESHKIAKTGQPIDLHLIETDDVVATLGAKKGRRWVVGFALETEDHRLRALAKLERKFCDLMVSNGPQAISSTDNEVEVFTPAGEVIAADPGHQRRGRQGICDHSKRLIDRSLVCGGKRWRQRDPCPLASRILYP